MQKPFTVALLASAAHLAFTWSVNTKISSLFTDHAQIATTIFAFAKFAKLSARGIEAAGIALACFKKFNEALAIFFAAAGANLGFGLAIVADKPVALFHRYAG